MQVVEVKAAIEGIADGVHGARRIPGKVRPGAVPLTVLGWAQPCHIQGLHALYAECGMPAR